jgi:hypothetical protein
MWPGTAAAVPALGVAWYPGTVNARPRDPGLRRGRAYPGRCGPRAGRNGLDDPGDWRPMTRAFRDGHAETWYAAGATLSCRGWTAPGAWSWPPPTRAGALPDKATAPAPAECRLNMLTRWASAHSTSTAARRSPPSSFEFDNRAKRPHAA